MVLNLHTNVLRSSLFLLTLSALTSFNTINGRISPPSEESLVADFCQRLLNDPSVSVSASELANDIVIIGPSLSQLLTFAWQRPALQKALHNCIKVLLMRNMHTPQGQATIKKMHENALAECQQEYNFFCMTDPEGEMVASCLKNLGLYYGPLTTIIEEQQHEEPTTKKKVGDRRKALIGAGIAGIALFALFAVTHNR